jgi:hypothetical protein
LAGFVFGLPVNQDLTELADEPSAELRDAHLAGVIAHGEVDLRNDLAVQLRSGGDDSDQLRDVLLSNKVLGKGQHFDNSVDLPLASGRILLADLANLVAQFLFKVGVYHQ